MDESKIKKITSRKRQKQDLLAAYDDFIEFHDYCSFLCDAVSALFSESMEGEPDRRTMMGLRRQCGDLKERAERLEEVLEKLYKEA